jgi:hypothetical protein
MRFPNKELLEFLQQEYPPGTRVRLTRMDDPPGTAFGYERHGDRRR